jgi:cytochrome c5
MDPETVYNTYCMACHTTGAAGAPVIGEVSDWEPRIAKGLDVLYSNAINGIGTMPAKGLCMDCSDEDIESTVDYILSQSE